MIHADDWYAGLAADLGHSGFVTLAEIRQAEAREARETAAAARWQHNPGGPYWTEQDNAYYQITREPNGRAWQIDAFPAAIASDRYVRHQGGIRTLAGAKGLALAYPCFRCGLAGPLTLMIPVLPARPSLAADPRNRWKCLNSSPCEAERARLLTDKNPGDVLIEEGTILTEMRV